MTKLAFAFLLPVVSWAGMIINIGGTVSGGIFSGGTSYTDNQAGVDTNPAVGIMDIGTFLNGVSVNFVIQSFGATSGSPVASLTMTSNSNLTAPAVLPLSVNIAISDTGFTVPKTPLSLTQTVNLLSSTGGITGSATGVGYYGDSNTNFDVNGDHTSTANASVLNGVATNTVGLSGSISGPALYSLTTALHLEITARGTDLVQNVQLNANLAAQGEVPEVASIIMIVSGLAIIRMMKKRGWGNRQEGSV